VEDGAYLYYDTNKEVWIHAGMVASRAFIEPGNEHFKCSKKPNTSSDFYSSYPSRDGPTAKCKARKGYFENLEQQIALGYGLQQPVSDLVQIFQLSDREKKKIQSLHFTMKGKDAPSMDDKYRRAIHYLCEMAYGLCLSSSYNISSNPGWEQALKQYVGKSK
jgi:hypothetical protein